MHLAPEDEEDAASVQAMQVAREMSGESYANIFFSFEYVFNKNTYYCYECQAYSITIEVYILQF